MLNNNFERVYPIALKSHTIKYPKGYECIIVSEHGDVYYSYDTSGEWKFIYPYCAKYTIQCITAFGISSLDVVIDEKDIPDTDHVVQEVFSYSGTWSHDTQNSADFYVLTKSGTLIPTQDCVVDVCLIGGGNAGSTNGSEGNGGAGGQVVHQYGVELKANTSYNITIAAAGGTTKAFNYQATNQGVAGGRGADSTGSSYGEAGKTGTYLFGNTNFKAYGASGAGGTIYSANISGGFYGGGSPGVWGSDARRAGGNATAFGGGGGGEAREVAGAGNGYQGAVFIRKHQ